jgi:hypothetical protein
MAMLPPKIELSLIEAAKMAALLHEAGDLIGALEIQIAILRGELMIEQQRRIAAEGAR